MTTSPYGRAQVEWPDLGSPAGAPLHAEVTAGVAFLSNNLLGRWSGSQAIAASNTFQFEHNFGLTLANLRVRLYESGAELSESAVAASFTVAEVDSNNISVTNNDVVSRTIQIYVEPIRRLRKADLDPNFDAVIEQLSTIAHNDTVTGTAATAGAATTSYKRLTVGGTLVSLAGLAAPSPSEGRLMIVQNATGATISVLNEDAGASAADRIVTGTGATLSLSSGASLWVVYDVATSRWDVIGGSGGGGYANSASLSLAGGGTISGVTSGFQKVRVQGASAAVTLSSTPFGTTAPLDGTEVVLVGNSNTNTVTITYNDAAKGVVCNGDVALTKGANAVFIYDATLDRWLEKSRNIISIA